MTHSEHERERKWDKLWRAASGVDAAYRFGTTSSLLSKLNHLSEVVQEICPDDEPRFTDTTLRAETVTYPLTNGETLGSGRLNELPDGAPTCHCGRESCDCYSSRTEIADAMREAEGHD